MNSIKALYSMVLWIDHLCHIYTNRRVGASSGTHGAAIFFILFYLLLINKGDFFGTVICTRWWTPLLPYSTNLPICFPYWPSIERVKKDTFFLPNHIMWCDIAKKRKCLFLFKYFRIIILLYFTLIWVIRSQYHDITILLFYSNFLYDFF